jgi:two-component system, chemotaxis family, CheB/CheR fusion protein
VALVVIQHLDPRAESHLVALLSAHTSLTVVEAQHGARVQPEHVYVIQPNTSVAIADGVLSVTPRPDDRRPYYPVDHFFRSLAAVQGSLAVGLILSGTGSDGTLGALEIKAAGGVIIAQDERSAQHPGMPDSAVSAGVVDMVMTPVAMAAWLAALPETAALTTLRQEPSPDDADHFRAVVVALRRTSGVDFGQYRETTLRRRTERRMLLRGIRSLTEYAAMIERDRAEAEALYRDVLINVTSFFRDPEVFEELEREIFPALIASQPESVPIRVWAPGCSTGQEAYSLAITLLDSLAVAGSVRPVQVFATDLGDQATLEKARLGVYPESIEAEVSAERLASYFVREQHHYRVAKRVRDVCTFARQNLMVDPPFSRVDLVSCRNVLIYMSPVLQDRLLPVFHFAINPGGYLLLGAAETIGTCADLFEPAHRAHKIFRRRDVPRRPPLTFVAEDWLAGTVPQRAGPVPQPPVDFQREADRLVMARYAPPSVLVNEDFDVLQYSGRTAAFLELPSGQPTTNLLRMVRDGLLSELRSALTEAKATGGVVSRPDLRVDSAAGEVTLTLRVQPVLPARARQAAYLVVFEPSELPIWTPAPARPEPADTASAQHRDVAWLRSELTSTKQYLQSVLDQQDTVTQELRAAHEEVLSSNEELQSTNEELETTKEELQSSNEELTTVNEQFQLRNHELDTLTDELTNFISSADLPMVTIGLDRRIRRTTEAARHAFNLLPSDVGRSIAHIKFAVSAPGLEEAIPAVAATGQPWEREVTDHAGRWWLLRLLPYRTVHQRVEGVTLVAIDIDAVKRGHALMEERDYAVALIHALGRPLVVLDARCRVEMANAAYYTLCGGTPADIDGRSLFDSAPALWGDPAVRQALGAACLGQSTLANHEMSVSLPGIGPRTLILNAEIVAREGHPTVLLLSIDDVTEARAAEALRIDAEALRALDQRKDQFLGILAHELRNPLAPMQFAVEMIRRARGVEAVAKARHVLERQLAHMVRIVDDLLDLARIRQGKIELRQEQVTLGDIVQNATELCRAVIEDAGHELSVVLPAEPVTLWGDPVRLTQVLVNLLNNAAKFTPPPGRVALTADLTDGDSRGRQIRIRVRDTGIGFDGAFRPLLFDLFAQGDQTLERTRGGLGVGLTLVRRLVEMHGGSVDAHSDGEGHGAEFTVRLPVVSTALPVASPVHPARPGGPASPLRILVADDSDDGRELLALLLRNEGHEVATAPDGPQAVAVAAEFHPDVGFIDIGMPGFNGYVVAERLRQSADRGALLVAVSGLGQEGDKQRALEAGFDHHLTKPVDFTVLADLLATARDRRPA